MSSIKWGKPGFLIKNDIAQLAHDAANTRTPAVLERINIVQEGRDVERDGFAQEMALQYGFTFIDDDAEVYIVTGAALADFMAVLGFRTTRERAARVKVKGETKLGDLPTLTSTRRTSNIIP